MQIWLNVTLWQIRQIFKRPPKARYGQTCFQCIRALYSTKNTTNKKQISAFSHLASLIHLSSVELLSSAAPSQNSLRLHFWLPVNQPRWRNDLLPTTPLTSPFFWCLFLIVRKVQYVHYIFILSVEIPGLLLGNACKLSDFGSITRTHATRGVFSLCLNSPPATVWKTLIFFLHRAVCLLWLLKVLL